MMVMREYLVQVLLSWQVWAVTIALLFYWSLVFYVARLRKKKAAFRPRVKVPRAPLIAKKSKKEVVAHEEDEDDDIIDDE